MSRTMPTECEHGEIIDWGDFGPCQGDCDHEGDCPNFQDCPDCMETRMTPEQTTAIPAHDVPTVEQRREHTRDPEDGDDFGHRPVNNWGSGDLPAPFATGDLLWLAKPYNDKRMRPELGDPGWYVVVYSTSIDEGDAWYFRVERLGDLLRCSGRMHVIYADRAEMGRGGDQDWMEPFQLVESADPEGLAKRQQMLADGWAYEQPPRCPTCDQRRPYGVDSGRSATPEPTRPDPSLTERQLWGDGSTDA